MFTVEEWIVSDDADGVAAPYCRAATFTNEHQAGRIYQRVQDVLFAATKSDLSAYRFYVGPTCP